MRITKVTTKIGDGGTTALGDGTKVSKSDLRINCIGEIDELNSFIGHAKIATSDQRIFKELIKIQNNLLNLGAEISIPGKKLELVKDESVSDLEDIIEQMNKKLPSLKEFVLPGGDEFSARLHIARTVCRRAERNIVNLVGGDKKFNIWIQYLNRLSDYLFVLSRFHLSQDNIHEEQWSKI